MRHQQSPEYGASQRQTPHKSDPKSWRMLQGPGVQGGLMPEYYGTLAHVRPWFKSVDEDGLFFI